MFSVAGDAGGGHERAHDPCRADRKEWTAEHPLPPARVGWAVAGLIALAVVISLVAAVTAVVAGT